MNKTPHGFCGWRWYSDDPAPMVNGSHTPDRASSEDLWPKNHPILVSGPVGDFSAFSHAAEESGRNIVWELLELGLKGLGGNGGRNRKLWLSHDYINIICWPSLGFRVDRSLEFNPLLQCILGIKRSTKKVKQPRNCAFLACLLGSAHSLGKRTWGSSLCFSRKD